MFFYFSCYLVLTVLSNQCKQYKLKFLLLKSCVGRRMAVQTSLNLDYSGFITGAECGHTSGTVF